MTHDAPSSNQPAENTRCSACGKPIPPGAKLAAADAGGALLCLACRIKQSKEQS